MDPTRFNQLLAKLKISRKRIPNAVYKTRQPEFLLEIKLPKKRCNVGDPTDSCPARHRHLWSKNFNAWYHLCMQCSRKWGLHSRGLRPAGRPAGPLNRKK